MNHHQMIDLIFALEAKSIQYMMRAIPHAGICALGIPLPLQKVGVLDSKAHGDPYWAEEGD